MERYDFSGKRVLIVGFGREGEITKQYLESRYKTAQIGIADKKTHPEGFIDQESYDIAIRSPGVHPSKIRIPYTTATNIFLREVHTTHTVVGVTGSKGKSTTSSLIYEILKTAKQKTKLLGNIGTPMLTALLEPLDPADIFVCELSSFMTMDLKYAPHISVITALFPDHMDFHGDLESYYQAKCAICKYAGAGDYIVFDKDNTELARRVSHAGCRLVTYGPLPAVPEREIPLPGSHNRDNIRAAATVCRLLGCSEDAIIAGIKSFVPLRHRLQFVGTFRSIRFYDDAISTTPESTIAALDAVSDIGCLILGGQDRGYDFTALAEKICSLRIPNLIIFPDSGSRIRRSIESASRSSGDYNPRYFPLSTMEDAVEIAYQYCPKEFACVLSCASPSYSLWKNFEEKGDQFQHFVQDKNHETH